jgi:hypothetical protein
MSAKYRALERRMVEMERVVDRCCVEHGSHVPASTVATIRTKSLRYAEGIMVLMSAVELASNDPYSTALRGRVAVEIESETTRTIKNALGRCPDWVN